MKLYSYGLSYNYDTQQIELSCHGSCTIPEREYEPEFLHKILYQRIYLNHCGIEKDMIVSLNAKRTPSGLYYCQRGAQVYSLFDLRLTALYTDGEHNRPSQNEPRSFGAPWIGNIVEGLGLHDKNPYMSYRGSILEITPIAPDRNGKSDFTFYTETAWAPCHEAFAAVIEAVGTVVDVGYEAEEPGMEIYTASSPYMTDGGEYYIDSIDVSQAEWKSIFGNDGPYGSCYISEEDLNNLLNDVPGSDTGQKLKEVNARLSEKEIYLGIHKIDFMPFAEAAA